MQRLFPLALVALCLGFLSLRASAEPSTFPSWYSFLAASSNASHISVYNVTLGTGGHGPFRIGGVKAGQILASFQFNRSFCFGFLYFTPGAKKSARLGQLGCGEGLKLTWPYGPVSFSLPTSPQKLLGSVTATYDDSLNGIVFGIGGFGVSFVNLSKQSSDSTVMNFPPFNWTLSRALGAYSPQQKWFWESRVFGSIGVNYAGFAVPKPSIPFFAGEVSVRKDFDIFHTSASNDGSQNLLGVVRDGTKFAINLLVNNGSYSIFTQVMPLDYLSTSGKFFSAYYSSDSTYYHILFQESIGNASFAGRLIVANVQSKKIESSTPFNVPVTHYFGFV